MQKTQRPLEYQGHSQSPGSTELTTAAALEQWQSTVELQFETLRKCVLDGSRFIQESKDGIEGLSCNCTINITSKTDSATGGIISTEWTVSFPKHSLGSLSPPSPASSTELGSTFMTTCLKCKSYFKYMTVSLGNSQRPIQPTFCPACGDWRGLVYPTPTP